MGKTAIVTGASRGIGRAIAVRLAKADMNVVINYAGNDKAANETAALCEKEGVKTLLFKGSVSDAEAMNKMFSDAKEEFGSIDVLVNNAGITKDGLLLSMKEEDFDGVIDINLKGTFICSKLAAKIMLRQRFGSIVNLSSVVGVHGNAGQTNYSASKGGVIAFTKSMAKELAARGITVNAVAPGYIATDMTDEMPQAAKEATLKQIPLGTVGCAEDVANAVNFLVSDEARYITGQVLGVDGGMGA